MTTLFKQLPIAEKLWADSKDPNKYTIDSKAMIKWKCPNGHIYKKAINKFANNQECQTCRKLNNRLTNNPKAVEMWDYEKNDVDISEATLKSSKSYWWKCNNGHSFRMQCDRFYEHDGECPYCKINTIDKNPELMKQFDIDNNPDIDVHYTSCNSKKMANWKCPKCGYTWKAKIASRYLSAMHCPCCEEKTVVMPGFNDIFTLYPDLKKDFNDDYDASNEGVSSSKPTNWKCHICGYEWETALGARINNGKIRSCPACTGLVRTKSYAEQYPELKKYYSESNPIPLEEVITGQQYKKKFIWKCDKHGEFEQYLSAMVRGLKTEFKGCPYCAGKKVKLEDSFGFNHPELIDEYSPKNKDDIYDVTQNSSKNAIWHCSTCGNEWEATFNSRSLGYGNCKVCNPHPTYKKMLIDERPDLERFYRGGRPFNSYAVSSNEDVDWECNEGHKFKKIIYKMNKYSEFTCPVCNNQELVVGVNDLASIFPELIKEWSPNNDKKPNEIIKTSWYPAKWICKECGYEYQAKVQDKINGFTCPVCDNRITVKDINDLSTTHPDLAKEYSKSNDRDILTVRKNLDQYYLWTCPDCNSDYYYKVKDREVGDDTCPYCANKRVLPGINDLETLRPDIANMFTEDNDKKPSELLPTSNYFAHVKCPVCGDNYTGYVKELVKGIRTCPGCDNKRVVKGFNDLKTLHPELETDWSTNNPSMDSVMANTKANFLWICKNCGGEHSASVDEHLNNEDNCPYCENKKVLTGLNDLQTIYPELVDSYSSNNESSALMVLHTSKQLYKWNCPRCGGEYNATIEDRKLEHCPYCENKKALAGYNDLATTHPHLSKLWSDKNEKNISDVLSINTYNAIWECDVCGGSFSRNINEMVNDDSCPYCENKKVLTGLNDLQTIYPELTDSYSLNNDLPVSEVLYISKQIYKWKCSECEGEYNATIEERRLEHCPYCENKKVLPGFNDLATTHPHIAKEWGIENYLLGIGGPENYKFDSTKQVYWKCPNCNTRYKMPIDDRVICDKRHHEPCWKCNGRMKNILKL